MAYGYMFSFHPWRSAIKETEFPSHADAIEKLNSTQAGFKVLEERRRTGYKAECSGLEQMPEWLRRLGYNVSDLNRLNIVHVAGTKGKGTTCAFVSSILLEYQRTVGVPRKIGLYTSPHLVSVRERICINSQPISEELFARYFFAVWDALESSAIKEELDPAQKPGYFRFLTLMSFHVFLSEGVDAAIIEVGVGGETDVTNVIPQPVVTGITTLDIDHVKSGSSAFTVSQVPDAREILEQRAQEKNVNLGTVEICSALRHINIKPTEDFQKANASLAIVLACTLLNIFGIEANTKGTNLPTQFVQGLEKVVWRGRCETVDTGRQHWHLDGAHTERSLEVACSWFGRGSHAKDSPHVLLFNQQSLRDAAELLRTVHRVIYESCKMTFQYALFCTNTTYKDDNHKADLVNRNVNPQALKSLSLQGELVDVWHGLDSSTEVAKVLSIEEAIEYVRNIKGGTPETEILVTGSFLLVGGALMVLEDKHAVPQMATAQ
ncbi:folylpolyglutamate synthase [Aspergillus sclerotioniger CBS 115572]|uniref:Folylpolyglutamate synthase n=1 Tax=Aspergillus sclerotioniger CBS 115572 TaxID=1450535 RepID=A0A317WTQ4_9EURO|nr:folylpolyglutamate synthase [Aspergillus sclerotioniger CBS 115572]PWY88567.1 folylpolyglutamate synthase [Aspergillus sclerotioniger CBS 115572]